MTDRYPQNFEIDVERDMVRRYLRIRWFFSWLFGIGLFGGFIGFTPIFAILDQHRIFEPDGVLVLWYASATILFFSIIAILMYLLRSHWLAARMASSLQVSVEGPFLRIIQENYERVDRKLHFRSIVDYAAVDDILMRRFGLMALKMHTTGGSPIQLIGIKDCLKVRDMLAEIDSIREL